MCLLIEALCKHLNLTKNEAINFLQNHELLSYNELGKIFSLSYFTIKNICNYLNLDKLTVGNRNYIIDENCKEKIKEFLKENPNTKSFFTKLTCFKKYGVENPSQSKISRNHYKETCLRKYGVDSVNKCKWKQEKTKEVIREKYGCDYITQTQRHKDSIKQTQFKRYGDWYSNTKERKDRIIKTCQEKYGTDNVFQNEEIKSKIKNSMIEKYGIEHPSKINNWKEIIENSKIRHYGSHEEYSKQMRKNSMKKYKLNDITFDSTWEVCYYIYLTDNNINFKYHPCNIPYFVNNIKYSYEVDFMVEGKLYEIKGDYFFYKNKDGSLDKTKMKNPYNENIDKVNAKYKCMLDNNVTVLTKKDLKYVFDYIYKNYGKDFIKKLRKTKQIMLENFKNKEI